MESDVRVITGSRALKRIKYLATVLNFSAQLTVTKLSCAPGNFSLVEMVTMMEKTTYIHNQKAFRIKTSYRNSAVRDVRKGGILMSIQYHPPFLIGDVFRKRTQTRYKTRSNSSTVLQLSSVFLTDESGNYEEPVTGTGTSLMRGHQRSACMLSQPNTIGVIGGVSVLSTLVFMEKLACWGSRNGKECPPFVVCSDPVLSKVLSLRSPFFSARNRMDHIKLNQELVIENLRYKRNLLQQSGARGLAMPCHLSHAWHGEISEDCSLPFLHVGDCVAMELKNAKLKPIHAADSVRIGLLTTDSSFVASYYQDKLQNQGFEVELLDEATEEHVLVPAMEALHRKDIEGARNLLRIAIHVLLVRGVNVVILASDDLLGILPHNDPLLRKCIDPMDALARSTIHWAETTAMVHQKF